MQYMETDGDYIELHTTQQEKALLIRAAALSHLDMASFVTRAVLTAAQEVIERTDHIKLSERGVLFVLDLLENPPPPNAKLIAAARALDDNLKRLEEMQNDSGMA